MFKKIIEKYEDLRFEILWEIDARKSEKRINKIQKQINKGFDAHVYAQTLKMLTEKFYGYVACDKEQTKEYMLEFIEGYLQEIDK